MSNRLRTRPAVAKPALNTRQPAPPPVEAGPRPKLSWVLGVLLSVLLLAAAVAGLSMWLILRKHA